MGTTRHRLLHYALIALVMFASGCSTASHLRGRLEGDIHTIDRAIQELYQLTNELPPDLESICSRSRYVGCELGYWPYYDVAGADEYVLWYDISNLSNHIGVPGDIVRNEGQVLDKKEDFYGRFKIGVGTLEASRSR